MSDFEAFKPDLQSASDIFFSERAMISIPGKLGALAQVDHPITDRPPDDPTLLENKFFPADLVNRPYAEHTFLRKVGNLRSVIGKLNNAIDEHGLDAIDEHGSKKYPEITIIMPHVVMQDAATLPILIGQSALGEGRTAEDNYIIISRLIPYLDYRNPLKRVLKPWEKVEPISAFDKLVRPVGNVVQIFPETESTKPLYDTLESEIGRYNVRAIKEMERYQQSRANVAKQILKFVPPSASRTKKEKQSGDTNYAIEYVSERTVRMLYKDHKRGIPIWPIGINYSPMRIYLPGFRPQDIKLHSVTPIFPNGPNGNRDTLDKAVFEELFFSKLLESAVSVVRHPVYQKPRPIKS